MANSLIEKSGSLPELPRQQQIYARAEQILIRRYPSPPAGLRYHTAATDLAALDAILPAAEAVLEELRDLARPATKLEIAKQLAVLVKCYPNAGTADGEIYGRLLIEDVAANQPSFGDLEGATRELRRTSKFLPTISEVLTAVAGACERRQTVTRQISELTTSRPQHVRAVEKEHLLHEQQLEYLRTRYLSSDQLNPYAPPF